MTDLYVLPTTDTHCFDEDEQTDCWSFSREILLQEIAKAELRGREAMRQECVKHFDSKGFVEDHGSNFADEIRSLK